MHKNAQKKLPVTIGCPPDPPVPPPATFSSCCCSCCPVERGAAPK